MMNSSIKSFSLLAVILLTGCAAQHAQAAKKAIYKGFGMTFRMSSKNFAYLNDSLCAIDEDNKDATVYQSGLYNVIVYHHTGKVALMKEGQFVGYLK